MSIAMGFMVGIWMVMAGNVADMSPTRQNVAYFCPDMPILAT
jgi:hypothetical protein